MYLPTNAFLGCLSQAFTTREGGGEAGVILQATYQPILLAVHFSESIKFSSEFLHYELASGNLLGFPAIAVKFREVSKKMPRLMKFR